MGFLMLMLLQENRSWSGAKLTGQTGPAHALIQSWLPSFLPFFLPPRFPGMTGFLIDLLEVSMPASRHKLSSFNFCTCLSSGKGSSGLLLSLKPSAFIPKPGLHARCKSFGIVWNAMGSSDVLPIPRRRSPIQEPLANQEAHSNPRRGPKTRTLKTYSSSTFHPGTFSIIGRS